MTSTWTFESCNRVAIGRGGIRASRATALSPRYLSFRAVVEALSDLPDGTVIDGEIVALDDSGRPEFTFIRI